MKIQYYKTKIFYHLLLTLFLSLYCYFAQAQEFEKHTIQTNVDGARHTSTFDLDQDGDIDILGVAYQTKDIIWWENNGSENFTKHTVDGNLDGALSVLAEDIDGDGDYDLVCSGARADDIIWYENDGSENFTKRTIDGSFNGAYFAYPTDLDQDGDMDILGMAYIADDIVWYENDGSENFMKHTIDGSFNGASHAETTDIDGDGDLDIVATAYIADDIVWYENDGSENFMKHTIDGNFNGARWLSLEDVNGDGDLDILAVARLGHDVAWWENDGSGSFTKYIIDDNFNKAETVYAKDMDNDGDLDVVAAAYGVDEIVWWENDGTENFTKNIIDESLDGSRGAYAEDIDGDGDIDIVGAGYEADIVVWYEKKNSEINLQGNTINISNGETIVNISNNTDFGAVGTGGKTLSFTIQNLGAGSLIINTGGITFSGTDASMFSITGTTLPLTVASNEETTIQVMFNPTGANGIKNASIEILSNDFTDPTYTFALSGCKINQTVDGSRGKMLSLDGTGDYVEISNTTAIDFTKNFTLEAWIKPSSDVTNNQGILTKVTNGSHKQYALSIFSGQLKFDYERSGNNFDVRAGTIQANTWQHVAISIDNSLNYSMYIDGIVVATGTISTEVLSFSEPLEIGRWGGSYDNHYFTGSIDEVRIWNEARSQSDIRENMHLTLAGNETGLVAYYQFNEDTGNSIDNISGNNGTAFGDAITTDSEVAVASGTVASQTPGIISNTHTKIDFDEALLDINFYNVSNATDEFVVYQLRETPYNNVTGFNATTDNYWVVRHFGSGTFEIDGMEFTLLSHNEISTTDEGMPSNFTLHKRGSAEYGTWGTTYTATFAEDVSKTIRFGEMSADGMNIISLSQFIISNNNNSGLPISLLSFEARRKNVREVILNWATATEKDNAGFEIEISKDGQNFEKLGFVEGQGNSSSVRSYEFLMNNSESGYYRLKQIDFDGSFSYSPIRFVKGMELDLTIYPNPSQGEIHVDIPNYDNTIQLRIFNLKGKEVLSLLEKEDILNEKLNKRFLNLEKGLYIFKVHIENKTWSKKVILK